jgi:hypothetical protein
MKFIDTAVNQQHRFSLGREVHSGRFFVSFPVSNAMCDYEEFYEIPAAMHDHYPRNFEEVLAFVERCRQHLCDDLLFMQPGRDRGTSC